MTGPGCQGQTLHSKEKFTYIACAQVLAAPRWENNAPALPKKAEVLRSKAPKACELSCFLMSSLKKVNLDSDRVPDVIETVWEENMLFFFSGCSLALSLEYWL